MVEQLIAAGAGLDVKDNDGYEPIYSTATAVRYPSRQPRFVGRETALIHAAAGGHTDITAALIFAGADVDVSNNAGYGQHLRGSWVRSRERSSALRPGRETAEAVSEAEGTSAEYVAAVRKVRRVEHSRSA